MYKDDSYENTVNRIKLLLDKNGISVNLKVISGVKGVYYANLNIDGTSFYTNGKGFSEKQATAGAYGELMERLQNMTFFRFPNTFVMDEKRQFLFSPDEMGKDIDYVLSKRKYLGHYYNSMSVDEAREMLRSSLMIHSQKEQEADRFICVPYDVDDEAETIFLPAELIKHIYATNGMCAGNTKEEALVQGISEVFERYANYIILKGKITPADIPETVLRCYNFVSKFIDDIHENGNYRVIFKDCSLGIGLPVVCLIIIDNTNGKYFVKFGAHPVLEEALNRTIMELFQGRKIEASSFWFKEVRFYEKSSYEKEFKDIFRSGDGEYPTKLFENEQSYLFDEERAKIDGNNKWFLIFLKQIIKRNGWTFMFRDMSFLGFPTYQVIIPEISEVVRLDKKFIDSYSMRLKVNTILRRLPFAKKEEISDAVDFILDSDYTLSTKVSDFIGISLMEEPKNHFDGLILGDLVIHYYLQNKEYKKMLKVIDVIIADVYKNNEKLYYKCLRNSIYSIYILNESRKKIESLLFKFYDEKMVNKVISDIDPKNDIFKGLPMFDCNECEKCGSKEKCKKRPSYILNGKILNILDAK